MKCQPLGLTIHLIITGSAGVLTLVLSYAVLLPWISRNLPTVQDLLHEDDDARDSSLSADSVVGENGIVMTEKAADESSLGSEKASLQRSPTHSEDGSLGSLDPKEKEGKESAAVAIDEDQVDIFARKPRPTSTDDAHFCFRVLLVFNAALKSFAHGANDTANATGPFSAVLEIHDHGLDICADDGRQSPIWIMVMAGSFVALGITTFGHKVIKTVGEKLTIIDFHSGFCIELGSCVTVVLATQLGIPVSTTHCQIGAVVGTGLVMSGRKEVHWRMLRKIAMTWVLTVPFSGLLSVALMEMLRPAFK
jgi:phosphate/sulfate permease